MPHLVVSISGHGYGHVAQTAPLLNLLQQRIPQLRLTVRSSVPVAYLRSRIQAPFSFLESVGDIGMLMHSALEVRVEESRAAYQAFHQDWSQRISAEAGLLRELAADMVLSNVGYLPLAGAQLAGIPNVAMCSLNWFDIYRHYCGDDAVSAQILACYTRANAFLRLTPGMEMPQFANLESIAPIARVGQSKRELIPQFSNTRLVLVSMGGVQSRLPMESWPRIEGVRWLVQENWQVLHPDAVVIETLPLNFSDLLASSDILLCKPGYGSFVEAACCATPLLYVDRADWPESAALSHWLQQHGVGLEISKEALYSGNFADALLQLCNAPRPKPVIAEGASQAADWISGYF